MSVQPQVGTAPSALDAWRTAVEDGYRARTDGSRRLFEQGRASLPGGDTRYSVTHRPHPLYFARGRGASVWDVDGNEYLDLNNNATALIHGHAHPAIVRAVQDQAALGTAWGAHNVHEIGWARTLCERVPSLERVRFTNSGTEATMHMVKVARAATGRELILKFDRAYHGTWDGLELQRDDREALVPSTGGVPGHVADGLLVGPWGDIEAARRMIEAHAPRLAGVILTPLWSADRFLEPPAGYLAELRELTAAHGVLLLFDEIISFRLGRGGAQERYGVVPDMTALGKVVGGGLPVGAFGGREDVMSVTDPLGDLRVTLAGTFNANPVTAAAGVAALELLTPEAYDGLDRLGDQLRSGLRRSVAAAGLPLEVGGAASLVSLAWTGTAGSPAELMASLKLGFANAGVWGFPIFGVSTVMSASDVEATLSVADGVFGRLASALRA